MPELDVMKTLMEECGGEHRCPSHVWATKRCAAHVTHGREPSSLRSVSRCKPSWVHHDAEMLAPVLIQQGTNQQCPVFSLETISDLLESEECIMDAGSKKSTNSVVLFCSSIQRGKI